MVREEGEGDDLFGMPVNTRAPPVPAVRSVDVERNLQYASHDTGSSGPEFPRVDHSSTRSSSMIF